MKRHTEEDAGGDNKRPAVCMDGVLGPRKFAPQRVPQPFRPRANSDPVPRAASGVGQSAVSSLLQRRLSQSAA
ncbi:hypothetical protein BASA81_000791 [Batrachochytrium salamandrivorans]|nr:hypothetical protein BASA81_000791 [Batrachochytrium salamandrivorans]